MRAAIVGAGAVGGLFGGLLARAGHRVSFVARGESLAAIRSKGVIVASPSEVFATGPLAASEDPGDLGAQDLVVVTVKAWQVAPIAATLPPLLGAETVVVPVQNGVEAADHLASALGEAPVVGGLCHVLATREAPGRARYIGAPLHVTLAERHGESPSARIQQLATALRDAGMTVATPPDIRAALWTKLLFVEPLGSVGAVTRATIDVVRALPETRAMLEAAMREVRAVAEARGVHLPEDAVATAMGRVDAMPAGATASMHRDLVEGRPSELREQTGVVVRFGSAARVPRPVHDFLFASLLPQARLA